MTQKPINCRECEFLTVSRFEMYPGACTRIKVVNDLLDLNTRPYNCPFEEEERALATKQNNKEEKLDTEFGIPWGAIL